MERDSDRDRDWDALEGAGEPGTEDSWDGQWCSFGCLEGTRPRVKQALAGPASSLLHPGYSLWPSRSPTAEGCHPRSSSVTTLPLFGDFTKSVFRPHLGTRSSNVWSVTHKQQMPVCCSMAFCITAEVTGAQHPRSLRALHLAPGSHLSVSNCHG